MPVSSFSLHYNVYLSSHSTYFTKTAKTVWNCYISTSSTTTSYFMSPWDFSPFTPTSASIDHDTFRFKLCFRLHVTNLRCLTSDTSSKLKEKYSERRSQEQKQLSKFWQNFIYCLPWQKIFWKIVMVFLIFNIHDFC